MKLAIVVATMLFAWTSLARADVPDFVTYSGRLTDGTAWGQSTTVALTFRLYGQEKAGAPLWEQEFPCPDDGDEPTCVALEDGYFSVMLGEGRHPVTEEPLGVTEVFADNGDTWLAVCVDNGCTEDDELVDRQRVGSVPYAVRASEASILNPGSDLAHVFTLALLPYSWVKQYCPAGSKALFSGKRFVRGQTGADLCLQNVKPEKSCAAVNCVYYEVGGDRQPHPPGDKDCDVELELSNGLWPWARMGTGVTTFAGEWVLTSWVVCCKE